jgi:hypothetical protein
MQMSQQDQDPETILSTMGYHQKQQASRLMALAEGPFSSLNPKGIEEAGCRGAGR